MRKPSGAILPIGFAALSSDNVKPLSSNESKRKLETYFEEPCKDKMMVIIVFSFVSGIHTCAASRVKRTTCFFRW